MGIKDRIKNYFLQIFLTRYLVKLKTFLKGKKTAIGALSFLLWVAIYAIPAFTPQYNWIVVYATQLRDLLQSAGIDLDNELFNSGVGFTVVGLLDKLMSYFKKEK